MKFLKQIAYLALILTTSFYPTLRGSDMNLSHETTDPIECSYGTWKSPITAEKVASGATSILNMIVDGDNTYWCEARPSNKGRYTIVRRQADGKMDDMTPLDFNVRTTVHEYGGGAFTVKNGIIYASNGTDLKLYAIHPGKEPQAFTAGQQRIETSTGAAFEGTRFADLRALNKGLVAIAESHSANQEAENYLAWIDPRTGEERKLASGYDFYSSPAISPDEKKIAWICWNHPEMPWTNTELWIADLHDGKLEHAQQIAGDIPEAIFQPQWSPRGELFFVTDRDKGWWNLHRYRDGNIENICPLEAEMAEPLWVFDRSTYAFLGDLMIVTYNQAGFWKLGVLDPSTKKIQPLAREATYIQQMRSAKEGVQFLEDYADEEGALIHIGNTPDFRATVLYRKQNTLSKEYLSKPQHITFPSGDHLAYGFFYAPKNIDYCASKSARPPLLVMIHGGPTSQAKGTLQLGKQYWTSQGFAVLDLNYGGSTGYGRKYRESLNHQWGVLDVEDCINGARFLAEQDLVDPNKLIIRGGSAGGFTTLAALASGTAFKAGASYYGVADITALAKDTHKFEAHYTDSLVGKYPEEKALWEARSPIHSVDKIQSPLIIFQGEDDPVVPKNQSIMIYEALKKRDIQVELHLYPGEQHGFRQPENIIHSLNSEADFYRNLFETLPKDSSPPKEVAIPSPYMEFSRNVWRKFRHDMPMSLTQDHVEMLQGQLDKVSMAEVEEIYLPLIRLLNMYIESCTSLYEVTESFLGHEIPKVPYIIGIAGSVAVGKSTTSRILQALLTHSKPNRRVDIVTTDGFLYPSVVLKERGLMQRKGFPESYDIRRLISFLSDLKAGKRNLEVPMYSHQTYDIISASYQTIDQPDVVIIEGVNVLQTYPGQRNNRLFVSDFFDFSIYVDAETPLIKKWFLERFSLFRERAKSDPSTFFHQFALLPEDKALAFAEEVWTNINERNLYENILPYKQRAQLILLKGDKHTINKIQLRKL